MVGLLVLTEGLLHVVLVLVSPGAMSLLWLHTFTSVDADSTRNVR